jgi:hypothetical protein
MRTLFSAILSIAFASSAFAQSGVGNLPPLNVAGNPSASIAAPPTAFPIFSTANTWTAIQNIIGSNVAPINADGFNFLIQNSALTKSAIFAPVSGSLTVYDLNRCTMGLPASSTISNANCFSAYIQNRSNVPPPNSSVFGNAVMFYGLITCGVSNSSCWGFNPRLSDTEDNLAHGTTNARLIGTEYDFWVDNGGPTGSIVQGSAMIIGSNFTVLPQFAAGHSCSAVGPYDGLQPWTFCYVSADGAVQTALNIGSTKAKVGSGAAPVNAPSQDIRFAYWDASGTEQGVSMFMTPANGSFPPELVIQALSGGPPVGLNIAGLQSEGQLLVSASTPLPPYLAQFQVVAGPTFIIYPGGVVVTSGPTPIGDPGPGNLAIKGGLLFGSVSAKIGINTPGPSTQTVCSDAAGNWFSKTGVC